MWASRSSAASVVGHVGRGAGSRAGRPATARSAKSIGLVGRDVAASAGRRAGPAPPSADSHSASVGLAAVGEDLGVLGDQLAAAVPAGQLQVEAVPDQQQRGAARHRAVRMTPQRRAGRRVAGVTGSRADSRT